MSSNAASFVADNETLFRAVRNDPRYFPADAQGTRRISSTAFNDANLRPSMDREVWCPGGASDTRERFALGSGVLSLQAADIRALTTTHGGTGAVYGVDVEPVPLPENDAHAKIFGRPPFDTDKFFDRIKQALTRIAVITIAPDIFAETEETT